MVAIINALQREPVLLADGVFEAGEDHGVCIGALAL